MRPIDIDDYDEIPPSDDLELTQIPQPTQQKFIWTTNAETRNADIAALTARIDKMNTDIKELTNNRNALLKELEDKKRKLATEQDASYHALNGHQKARGSSSGRDYVGGEFPWKNALASTSESIFGIKSFRLCQEGVCNANLDSRNIVCVMPTGGGKSLTYQLPALMTPGVTLVISPLLSLISDQIMHLRDAGVEAVKLTGATSKDEKDDINRRLNLLARNQIPPGEKEIKLLYVTPEKTVGNKGFQSLIQRLSAAGKLARIVIDEAHCVSTLGHDFRPDYGKLHMLKQMAENVPIMALSATCPPLVRKDILKILGLPDIVDGRNATKGGTVYFSSPLYRKNLHYSTVVKHSEGNRVLDDMVQWIKEHHPNDSGIIYCLSKKDTEKVAEELQKRGGVKTGVYHSERTDIQKERLHEQWRVGEVKVVCATIAFGLGIDKGDVRFVLHHSLSKSLDGFYQESGRAGRDGNDSDCVLFYRPQDGSTLSSMMTTEKEGSSKLHGMLKFAQDLRTCRKVQFAEYFSHSSELSISAWSTDEENADDPCGHCDNCKRSPDDLEEKDVTYETWQLLKILKEVVDHKGDVTLAQLAGLARGNGGAGFSVATGKGRKRKSGGEKASVDLDGLCGGKVELKREEIEFLLVELILQKYISESPHFTAYTTTMYMRPGVMAPEILRSNTAASIKDGTGIRVKVSFLRPKKATKTKGKGKAKSDTTQRSSSGGKRRQSQVQQEEEEDVDGEEYDEYDDDEVQLRDEGEGSERRENKSKASSSYDHHPSTESEDEWETGWQQNQRGSRSQKRRKMDPLTDLAPTKNRKTSQTRFRGSSSRSSKLPPTEVIEISDSDA